MTFVFWFLIGLVFIISGLTGSAGSILASIVFPGAMTEYPGGIPK